MSRGHCAGRIAAMAYTLTLSPKGEVKVVSEIEVFRRNNDTIIGPRVLPASVLLSRQNRTFVVLSAESKTVPCPAGRARVF